MIKYTQNQFIEKAMLVHNNFYTYEETQYINSESKVLIECPKHGKFSQFPSHHINGSGCNKCAKEKLSTLYRMTQEKFISRAKKKHNNFYDYSKVNFINTKTKIEIICPKHGSFKQKPTHHLSGAGCPKCKCSKGEREIIKYLESIKMNYDYQKRFHDCKHKNYLIFDFYIPEKNICIEYDGEQHFKSIPYFGGQKALRITQERDRIKTDYCKKNNIILLRITKINKIEIFNS